MNILFDFYDFRSTNIINGQAISIKEQCEIHDSFDGFGYQPSPDGIFTFELIDHENVFDIEDLKKLEIELDGSLIPF